MWAKPRAAPPPSARPMRGRRGGGGGGRGRRAATGGGAGVGAVPAAARCRSRPGRGRRRSRPPGRRQPAPAGLRRRASASVRRSLRPWCIYRIEIPTQQICVSRPDVPSPTVRAPSQERTLSRGRAPCILAARSRRPAEPTASRMYRYTEFDRQFVHQRAAQFRDQLRAPPRRRAARRRLPGAAPAERLVRPAPCADAARRRALRRAELEAAARAGRIAREYDAARRPLRRPGGGFGHFTTRQNCQFNWIALADAADVMDILADVDMHGIQTSGNCIRNITSDCFAGVAADEIVDPRPYCEILRQWSTLHPEFAFLPRKFKIAVSGTLEDRAATAWHDIGLRAAEERRRRDRLRGAGRRRHGPHADHRHRDPRLPAVEGDPASSSRRSSASTTATAGATTATRRGSRSWSRPRGRSSSTRSRRVRQHPRARRRRRRAPDHRRRARTRLGRTSSSCPKA